MRRLIVLTAALMSLAVSGWSGAITPDQELYNNLVFYDEFLGSDPSIVTEVEKELRKFDTTTLTKPSVALLAAMKNRCAQIAKLERKVAYHQEDGEQAIADRRFTDGIQGGVNAAGAVAQVDYAMNEKVDGNLLLYAIAGTIGGAMEHHAQGKKIRTEVNRAVIEVREEQKRIHALFTQDLNRFRKSPAYSKFDRTRLYRSGVFDSVTPDPGGSYFNALKDHNMLEMRIVSLNTNLASLAVRYGNAEWLKFADAVVKEWPTCVSKNHPGYSMALSNLSCGALNRGDHLGAERIAGDAIKTDPTNALAFNNRAIARLQLDKGKEAIKDIEKAIAIEPKNDWYRLSKALIYAQAFGDADRSLQALSAAYNLGYCDIAALRNDPGFQRISSTKKFKVHTNVYAAPTVKNGMVFADVHLKNNSQFYLTNVNLVSKTEGWNPTLKADSIPPGETHHWSFVKKPPAGKEPKFGMACDQNPK